MMLLFLALLTDGTQAFLSAGFLTLGGGVSATTAGAATPIAMPIAVGLGFITDITTSITFGAGLLLLLSYNGMLYMNYTFGGGIVELIPGLDVIPGWTLMTILCIIKKNAEEGKGGIAGKALATVVSGGGAAAVMATVSGGNSTAASQETSSSGAHSSATESSSPSRAPTDLKNIDGIRASKQPAEDTGAQTKLQYAA
jgi:hypothetical protein